MRVKRAAEVGCPLGGDLTLTPLGARSVLAEWNRASREECGRVDCRAMTKIETITNC